ncbi:hypothetical protein CPB84DRAFT_1848159 [Gymnopilus junonius]|uniref:Uncharacterized protein n=1 Tax=Gymnopilus junonius TaxID=109634 RepID=A0A9P5NLT4_GYMJU|nr:hypothetical protein CPB84DRAFT_1848159 [Gymnopilus junonius]
MAALYYSKRMDVYIHIARGAKDEGSPPEAKWYGLWNHFLTLIAADDERLFVFPQMDIRVLTDNETGAINKSTRYTDHALLDSMTEYANDLETIIRVVKKILLFLEVKAEGKSKEDAEEEVLEQIRHYFWMQDKDSDIQVIAISAIGASWAWANVQRSAGTSPAAQSSRAAAVYMQERPDVAFTTPRPNEMDPNRWSTYAEVGGLESNRQLQKVLSIIATRRL